MNEQKDDIKKKIITISRVDGIKHKDLESGLEILIGYKLFEKVNEKEISYTLWFTKTDKTSTKAYSQYKGQGLNIGSSVGIAYKEAPNNFKFKDRVTGEMKEAKSTNRTIAWFSEPANVEEYDDTIDRLQDKKGIFQQQLEEEAKKNEIPTIKVPTDEEIMNDISKIPF